MTDWIEHNGGPRPVANGTWVRRLRRPDWRKSPVLGAAVPAGPYDRGWGSVIEYQVLNQHLIDAKQAEVVALQREVLRLDEKLEAKHAEIDAARLEGIRLGLEAAVTACLDRREVFLSPEYATDQPLSSLQERFACDRCVEGIRAIDPATIAKEANRD